MATVAALMISGPKKRASVYRVTDKNAAAEVVHRGRAFMCKTKETRLIDVLSFDTLESDRRYVPSTWASGRVVCEAEYRQSSTETYVQSVLTR